MYKKMPKRPEHTPESTSGSATLASHAEELQGPCAGSSRLQEASGIMLVGDGSSDMFRPASGILFLCCVASSLTHDILLERKDGYGSAPIFAELKDRR